MENINSWENYDKKTLKKVEQFADEYKHFLNKAKTERECVDFIVNTIEAAGYREIDTVVKTGGKLQPGDCVYSVQKNKSVVMFKIGERPLEEGLNILGAHIDSPRLDVKQNPLYEDGGFAYLDTHYYGGVKKYQWVTTPLALHGVVIKKDGTTIEICIGEEEDDPVFFVSDLLIHLSQEQLEKKASKVIEGEALDIIIGNKPLVVEKTGTKKTSKDDSDSKKATPRNLILDILEKEYDIEEEDFLSAEIEVVPAGKTRDAGLDRSMIIGYGHDDRVCAYPSMRAMLEIGEVKHTACCILVDKEEIGSVGATGMKSRFFENAVAEVIALCGEYSDLTLRRCLTNSNMLSSDVGAGYDPSYASAFEKKNSAFMGHGMVLMKYTGVRGKSGSNDSNAEYMAELRRIFEKDNVNFQTAELGKVDFGGGGTIAYILALYGMNVIDSGVAVLNMHSPCEVINKADLYEAFKGYVAFLNYAGV